jgi:hypothetical protein
MLRLGLRCLAPVLAVGACATELPARIVAPTPESRSELSGAVSAALGGIAVTLAEDALTESSVLTLEHAPTGADARAATGREVGRPERFRLLKVGLRCVLVHDSDGARTVLAHTSCAPE